MARIYKDKRDGCWWIDYNIDGKRTRKKVGPSKEQAQKILNKILVEKADNKYLGIKKIGFAEFAQKYMENTMFDNKPSSVRRKQTSLKNLLSYFDGKNLDEITPLSIEEYKRFRMSRGIKNGTFNRERACLHHLFRKAMDWAFAVSNPVGKVRPLVENNEIVRYLSEDEYKRLIDVSPDWLRIIISTAIVTLLRKAELQNLKWPVIDFRQRLIKVINPKSNKDQYVMMGASLAAQLEKMKSAATGDYVFPGINGGKNKNIDKPFKCALKKAGIQNFRFHDLRHTGASYLAMAGVNLKEIQVRLRHKYITTTMRYVHLMPQGSGSDPDTLSHFVSANY